MLGKRFKQICYRQLNTHEGRYALTTDGDLQIVQLHRTDSGTYVCVASNGIGEPVSREVSLTVTGKLSQIFLRYGCCDFNSGMELS